MSLNPARSALLILAALAAPATTAAAQPGFLWLATKLEGDNMNPPVMTAGKGYGYVRVDKSTGDVRSFVRTKNVNLPQVTLRSMSGQVILQYFSMGTEEEKIAFGQATPTQLVDLENGMTEIVVTSPQNPQGEIAGCVIAPRDENFKVRLDPVFPNMSALGTVKVVYSPIVGVLYIRGQATGLTSSITAVTLKNSNGSVILSMQPNANDEFNGSMELASDDPLHSDLINGLMQICVETILHPNGEAGGSLVDCPAPFDTMTSTLEATQPPPEGDSLTSGHLTVELTGNRRLIYTLISDAPGTTATLRDAPGTSGTVLETLSGGPTRWTGTTRSLTTTEFDDLLAEQLFVVIEDAGSSAVIAGMISPMPNAQAVGQGCSARPIKPKLAANTAPVIGSDYEIATLEVQPLAPSALFIGFNIALPPIRLGLFGFDSECYLFTSPAASVPAIASDTGTVDWVLQIAEDLGFVGTEFYTQSASLDAQTSGVDLSDLLITRVR